MMGLRPPACFALTVASLAGPALSIGCARALQPLPALADLGGRSTPLSAAQVEETRRNAARLFAERDPGSVRRAVELWLRVAKSDPENLEGLVEVARTSLWLATHEQASADRERSARLAVQAARWCERIRPEAPACAYWLGAGLGVQAQERRATALDALPRILDAFKRAALLEPSYESGGPDRALALVYARAPGWPTGPGDPELALMHARKAVELKPGYPPNQLALAEALHATGDRDGGRAAYERALDLARVAGDAEPDAEDWIRQAEKALGATKGEGTAGPA